MWSGVSNWTFKEYWRRLDQLACNIVAIEDMKSHPEGVNAEFLAVPRVGEYVGNFGRVEQVNHGPAMLGDASSLPPYVTLFVRRHA